MIDLEASPAAAAMASKEDPQPNGTAFFGRPTQSQCARQVPSGIRHVSDLQVNVGIGRLNFDRL